MYAKPFVQGHLTVISGPVLSEKTQEIESFLDAVVDSGYLNGRNVLVFRHPDDDPNPEYVGRHRVQVTRSVREIYGKISPETRTLIVVGASHFRSSNIVDLADAVVRSNREMIVSGLNLDACGLPHGHMPGLMALADEVKLTKSICAYPACRNEEAVRSDRSGDNFFPVCTPHYFDKHSNKNGNGGYFEISVGPMFSGKSTSLVKKIRKLDHKGTPYVVIKWAKDARYGEDEGQAFALGKATLHSEEKVMAIMASTANDISCYLQDHPRVNSVFINELQFFPGIYGLISQLLEKGYHIYGDGLNRSFNRQPFNDVPKLMCLADKVNMHYAICVKCGHPATENQRMKQVEGTRIPAEFSDPLILPGGVDSYEARCIEHWELPGQPKLKYQFQKFRWD